MTEDTCDQFVPMVEIEDADAEQVSGGARMIISCLLKNVLTEGSTKQIPQKQTTPAKTGALLANEYKQLTSAKTPPAKTGALCFWASYSVVWQESFIL